MNSISDNICVYVIIKAFSCFQMFLSVYYLHTDWHPYDIGLIKLLIFSASAGQLVFNKVNLLNWWTICAIHHLLME